MLPSTEDFFAFKKERFVSHTVDNEVSALSRLTFYENLFTGQERRVRCPY